MGFRLLGVLLVVLGFRMVKHARRIESWNERVNRDTFGWELGRYGRLWGLWFIRATGAIAALMGIVYVVAGNDALSE